MKKIITITLNPAIDALIPAQGPSMGMFCAGGKGINVARAARVLGARVKVLAIRGGAAGWLLKGFLEQEKLPHDLFSVHQDIRINTTRILSSGKIRRIFEPGPVLTRRERGLLTGFVSERIKGAGLVVFAGSLPPGFPVSLFSDMVGRIREQGIAVAVDTSGPALESALVSGVDMIKPNRAEAESALGFSLSSRPRIRKALHTFLEYGIKNVLISLGKAGLVGCDGRTSFWAHGPVIDQGHGVGCGDAALAGFIVARMSGRDFGRSLRFAAACGAANMKVFVPGGIRRSDAVRMEQKITVERM